MGSPYQLGPGCFHSNQNAGCVCVTKSLEFLPDPLQKMFTSTIRWEFPASKGGQVAILIPILQMWKLRLE